ncbi:MAG: hypothetical protein PVSMB1_02430 [Gemmatimonadaceae bacterium]
MNHAGQLAMLRRLAGSPVASENFIFAAIDASNVSALQAEPAAPDPGGRRIGHHHRRRDRAILTSVLP